MVRWGGASPVPTPKRELAPSCPCLSQSRTLDGSHGRGKPAPTAKREQAPALQNLTQGPRRVTMVPRGFTDQHGLRVQGARFMKTTRVHMSALSVTLFAAGLLSAAMHLAQEHQ